MKFEELSEFIDRQDEKLIRSYEKAHSKDKRVLARAVKLAEEVGELCSEALAFNGNQRKEKIEKHTTDSLEGEIADVLIVTLLLAKTMNVDVSKALKNKIEKIDKRFKDI